MYVLCIITLKYYCLFIDVNKEVEEISSTYCDTVNFTCLSEAGI